MLQMGSKGPEIAKVQQWLKDLGYYSGGVDGIFGPATKQAVMSFQRAYGLAVDGIVGPQTMQALQKAIATKKAPILKRGSMGADVAAVQRRLAELGFSPGGVDGVFGYRTERAVRRFQASRGLAVDGIVGPNTWSALFGTPTKPSQPPVSSPSRGSKQVAGGKKVCIDPGHGGSDPGAVGPNGLKEAHVNLAVALKVAEKLRKAGVEVKLTRTSDVFIDLQPRCDIANSFGADYFVSIHCNSAGTPQAYGAETYCYQLGGKGEALAKAIQAELVAATGRANRGVKTANYYVLRRTSMPAVLIEMAFISNPEEERLLGSPDFQEKCAAAIVRGILKSM